MYICCPHPACCFQSRKNNWAVSGTIRDIVGPVAQKRRLLGRIVNSIILYSAPAWSRAVKNQKLVAKLTRIQRLTNIRITSPCRTVSADGVGVLTGVSTIEYNIA